MTVTEESRDLLVIHVPARLHRQASFVLMVVACVFCGIAAISLSIGLAGTLLDVLDSGFVVCTLFSGAIGALAGTAGWFGFRSAHDTDYHFDGKTECLIVRSQAGEKAIPFSRILQADVFDDGDESVDYVIRLRLSDPAEDIKLNDWMHKDHSELKALADKINRFLNKYRPQDVSIDLADADLLTMAKGLITNLWHDATAEAPVVDKLAAPVVRDGDVLFVCPECDYQTRDPGDQPPYECMQCSKAGTSVFLQDRTPGRTITVACTCGVAFAVPKSFVGTKRPCPKCGKKCEVTDAPLPPTAEKRSDVIPDTSFHDDL